MRNKKYVIICPIVSFLLLCLIYLICPSEEERGSFLYKMLENALFAFFSGSILAIVIDYIPFIRRKKFCKQSLNQLIDQCINDLEKIENFDTKQIRKTEWYNIFKDFIFLNAEYFNEKTLVILNSIKDTMLTSSNKQDSDENYNKIKLILGNWKKSKTVYK